MNYKKSYTPKNGFTPLCKIGECTLKDLEFGIIELTPGQKLDFDTENKETAFVILWGSACFTAKGVDYGKLGVRATVFASPKAECFYAGRNTKVEITAVHNVKIAVCATPMDVDTEPQAIRQDSVRVMRLGVKPWERDTSFIVDGTTNAKKLTIGEAYCTPGNWAGFPPPTSMTWMICPVNAWRKKCITSSSILSRASAFSASTPLTAKLTKLIA